jgi:hypothetical protein
VVARENYFRPTPTIVLLGKRHHDRRTTGRKLRQGPFVDCSFLYSLDCRERKFSETRRHREEGRS